MQRLYNLFLSIQHFLVMYTGAIVIPIIIGRTLNLEVNDIAFLISADLLTSGIATLLYTINTKWIGVGLPVILGASFNSVAAFITIGKQSGLATVYGSIIASGLFIFIFAPIIGKYIKALPPIITGIIITIIGLSLIPVAFTKIIDPSISDPFLSKINTWIFLITLLFIFCFHQLVSSMWKNLSILIGVILFSLIYYHFNTTGDTSLIHNLPAFQLSHIFHFGVPKFEWNAIITFCIIMLITSIESAGDLTALSEICEKELSEKQLIKSFRTEGIATCLGGIFNAFTYSNFAQNIGLVQLTGIKKVSIIQGTAVILILVSFSPTIAMLTTLIPNPVLGAAMLTMFGMITSNGLRILSHTNFQDEISIWTLALGIGFGVGISNTHNIDQYFPALIAPMVSNPIVMSGVVSICTYYSMSIIKKYKKSRS